MTNVADPLDLVRRFYRALNRSDIEAVVALHHPSCVLEHVFVDDSGVHEGREALQAGWTREFRLWHGALPGGGRVTLGRVAGIETGWGWVRADWSMALRATADGASRHLSGYSHFWVEDGLIVRQRSIGNDLGGRFTETVKRPPRSFPTHPVVGVGAVVFADQGRVVLVKRQFEPLAGQWSLPGGGLEVGETLESGVARELREETGLLVDVGPIVDVFDRILVDEAGRVRYHFVLVDFLCKAIGGTLAAGSDVVDVALADPDALEPYCLVGKARDVIARAVEMQRRPG